MRTELHYSLYDAECAADVYASDHDGLVVGMAIEMLPLRKSLEAGTDFDHIDPRAGRSIEENGIDLAATPVEAVRVVDKESHKDIASFGYLTDEYD